MIFIQMNNFIKKQNKVFHLQLPPFKIFIVQ